MQRKSVIEQFELIAAHHASASAISTANEIVSYQALNQEANRIAHALQALGADGAPVGLFLEPSASYVAGLLGIAKTGGVFLPLPVDVPAQRLRTFLELARPAVVLTQAVYAPTLQKVLMTLASTVQVITLDAALAEHPHHNLDLAMTPTAPAYVMFTSGSTGAPKAILGQQRGLSHFLRWELATFEVTADCRVAWLAPINFDVSLRDILVPLLAGGTLCIPDPEVRLTPHLLLEWLIDQDITLMHCVPTVLRLLTQALEDRALETGGARKILPALRHVLVAGEPLYGADIAAWRAVAGTTAALVNLYGPSETTLAKLYYLINDLPDDLSRMLPIGQPLPQTEALVLAHGAQCAVGDIGEIYLRTPYRSLGYLNDPVATATVFVANPLTGDAADVLYRTGDLGRWREDGMLECLGRKDGQFKINGVRMDVSEIEAALRQLPDCREVAVTTEPGSDHQPVVIAYLTRRDGNVTPLDLDAVSAALAELLPTAMHPRHLFVLPALPKTITGKLNRRALPPLERLLQATAADHVAPVGALETQIAAIWQQVLGIPQISATRRFQNYGGDSLKSIKVVAEIYRQFHLDLPLREFFAAPTVRGLATWLAQHQHSSTPSPLPLARASTGNPPATAAQVRLWSLYQMGVAPAAYNLAEAFVITGDLEISALATAAQIVVARHEALRTTFAERDGQVQQIIHETLALPLTTGDLRAAPQPLVAAQALFVANRDYAFDLERGPLLRLGLYQLPDVGGQAQWLFLFNIHHIISDVQSLALVMQELSAAYDALRQGAVVTLPPVTTQYRDFALWQAQLLQSGSLAPQREYWRQQFTPLPPPLHLPTDRPRPPVQTFVGDTCRTVFDVALLRDLERLAREAGTTRFAVLMSLVLVHLHRLTGQTEVVIGTPVLGRERPEFAAVVGYCVNTVAIRAKLEPTAAFAAVVGAVAAAVESAMINASYPFDALLTELPLKRDMSRGALFDVMVVEQAVDGLEFELAGATSRIFGNEEDAWAFSRFDLVFHFQTTDEGLVVDMNFNTDLFDASRIERYGQQLVTLAQAVVDAAVVEHCDIAHLPLLPAAELALLAQFSVAPTVTRPAAATIFSLVAEVAERTPEQLALVDEHRSLSYAAMLNAANQLAAQLGAAGIQAGERVAVIATRSVEAVIAWLGINKIGAVYVPIDAEYPPARIAALIAQVECRLALVEAATGLDSGQLSVGSWQLTVADGQVVIEASNPPNPPFSKGGFDVPFSKGGFCAAPFSPGGSDVPFSLGDSSSPPLGKGGAGGIDESGLVAYIIFTSGSTGKPKAVEVEHRSFINSTLGMIAALALGATDRTLQFASPSFDAALIDVMMALFSGGTVVLPTRALINSIPRFLAFMQHTGTTCVILPPTYLRLFNQALLPGLRILITAGEAAPVSELVHYAQTIRTFNAYGPTEAAVSASIYEVHHTDAARARVPIGRPLPNTQLHIFDAAFNPVPIGVVGDIFLAGAGLARGYAADPQRTAAQFIHHPTSGERLYRTGDRGWWLEDGNVDFLGRTDHQVKISGHRIELSEVEHALRSVADIADAHVTTLAHQDGALALVGYYVATQRQQLWPSVAEFFVYDHVVYSRMAHDEARNQRYRAVFARHLPGKTVVDIGTGPFAILAQLAIEAGAKKVYAIDLLAETAHKARATVAQLGLEDRIEVIHGNALEVTLPEVVDVCISEIVGAIGGSEGAAKIINGVRRLLKDPTQMLPQRSVTRIAAVNLPADHFDHAFPDIAAHYVEKIFAEVGRPFDLRLCIKNLSREHLISTDGTFEDLDYTRDMPLEAQHEVTLTVTTDSVLTGLVVWLDLMLDAEQHIDILDHPGSWLPVLLPIFPTGVAVTAGAQLQFTVVRRLHSNGLNPDFILDGVLTGSDGAQRSFAYRSDHISANFRGDPFYAALFPAAGVRRLEPLTPVLIRRHLRDFLPNYAVPSYLVALDALPLTASGKVDAAALPAPQLESVTRSVAAASALEQTLLRVWHTALERTDFGVDDDFFALGGDSIRAIQIASALRSQGFAIEVKDIFTMPRVRDLAALLATAAVQSHPLQKGDLSSDAAEVPTGIFALLPIQRWFFTAVTIDQHHFNQAVELCWHEPLAVDAAVQAMLALWQRHEQLRVTFPTPTQQQLSADLGAPKLLQLTASATPSAYLAAAAQLQCGFDLVNGPLFGAVIWDDGAAGGRVLMVAHHLVVDAVSWLILIDDFARIYDAVRCGQQPQLPPKTAGYLTQISNPPNPPFPKGGFDVPFPQEDFSAADDHAAATFDAHLAADALNVLLETVVPERGISLEALLLGALAQVWAEITGRPLVVMVERHGRDQVPADMDVSRTVGWFTVVMTLTLDGHAGAYAAAATAAQRLLDTAPTVPSATADLVFNHLGTLTATAPGGAFSVNWDAPGVAISPAIVLAPGLEVLTALEGGRLSLSVTARDHQRGTQVLTALEATLAQIAAAGGVDTAWHNTLGVDLEHLLDAD